MSRSARPEPRFLVSDPRWSGASQMQSFDSPFVAAMKGAARQTGRSLFRWRQKMAPVVEPLPIAWLRSPSRRQRTVGQARTP